MNLDSQNFESYTPVYDVIPEKWEDARAFITEALKQVTNNSNIREIGWYLDTQILTGKSFIPDPLSMTTPTQFRSIFRMVINIGPVVAAIPKSVAHNIIFDVNFTLIQMWASATNSTTLNAVTITGNNVTMDVTNINVTSPITADRCIAVIEYLLEV